ncbi:MAG: ABC transporter substrate-binding protein [Chloroflexales bacterium]|nr:ABC transporter substrate-binding protein [Chloroflexales bacterium]
MNRLHHLLAALLAAALLLAACGDQPTTQEAPEPTDAPAATEAELTEDAAPAAEVETDAAAITVTDQRGTTLTLDQPADQIVTIPIPAAALMMAVDGSSERLVGIHPSSAQAIQGEILGEIFPEAGSIPSDVVGEGFAPNVESILALNPDLVIQWGNRGADLTAPLENAGLNVAGLNYGTQEDLETWITLFGDMIGEPERATQIIDWQRSSLAEIQTQAETIGDEPPRIIYFNRLGEELRVAGSDTYNDFYIQLVGGVNPAAEVNGFTAVNAEQVLTWNPDIVLIGNFDEATPDDVYQNPLWQEMSAVVNQRVYKAPLGGYRWDPPNQESPLLWRWLAVLAFPEVYAFDLRNDIRENYQLLYDYEPTEEQIDRILQLDVNIGAAAYERFVNE